MSRSSAAGPLTRPCRGNDNSASAPVIDASQPSVGQTNLVGGWGPDRPQVEKREQTQEPSTYIEIQQRSGFVLAGRPDVAVLRSILIAHEVCIQLDLMSRPCRFLRQQESSPDYRLRGRRGIALHQSVEARLGEMRGDERKVKQVLLNLLSNALKFTPEGGRVEVLGRVVNGMAEISVTDTGVGIPPEDQEAVFEEFRQVGTAEKKAERTGLGLALCRKFVELHGGRIWVKSEVGSGSTFSFTLPVRYHQ